MYSPALRGAILALEGNRRQVLPNALVKQSNELPQHRKRLRRRRQRAS